MKRLFILLISFLSFSFLISQKTQIEEPLIIQGQLTDCQEKHLLFIYEDPGGQPLIDTIKLGSAGNFYFKSSRPIKPQSANIRQKIVQINNLFVAPGYNLTIHANVKDYQHYIESKQISGIGAESNRYQTILDSIWYFRKYLTNFSQFKEPEIIKFINKKNQIQDSILQLVFGKKIIHDNYFMFFKELVELNNKFEKLYLLLHHVNSNNYDYNKSVNLVKENFDASVFNDLFRKEYLISSIYKTWFLSEYSEYLVNLDYKQDSSLRNIKHYKLEKINEVFKGDAKEMALYKRMSGAFLFSKSFDQLNTYKEEFEPYFSALINPVYKTSIEKIIYKKESELLRTQIGKPAPKFTLESNLGKIVSLEDFKGKVVYIDLWAS